MKYMLYIFGIKTYIMKTLSKIIRYPETLHKKILVKAAKKTNGNLNQYIVNLMEEDCKKP